MDILKGVDTTRRNHLGWLPLPITKRLDEGQRIAVDDPRKGRVIVGHAVHDGWRTYLVPDWHVPAGTDLTPFVEG